MSSPRMVIKNPYHHDRHARFRRSLHMSAALLLLVLTQGMTQPQQIDHAATKPRLLVLTDIGGDDDDQQSLVRLLLYNHAFTIEGLLATSRMQYGFDTRPEAVEKTIAAYGQVYDHLRQHQQGYAAPESLLSKVKSGLGDPTKLGAGWDSQASRWIVKTVEKPDDRPVWICIWGGSRELAQALWSVRDRRNKKEMAAFTKKIRVYCLEDQDRWGYWINKNFPELYYIFAGSCGDRSCQGFRGQYQTGDLSMQNAEWLEDNVRQRHGALGAFYPRNAERVNGMKECATPSFMYLYANGLMQPEQPQWGGWGGRFQPDDEGRLQDAADLLDTDLNERYTVSRWRSAFQRDLAARLDWCRTAARDSANHAPLVAINDHMGPAPLFLQGSPAETVRLDAGQSLDPDNNTLQFNWWIYPEASGLATAPTLANTHNQVCTVVLPPQPHNQDVHIILEVTDDGLPPLTSYGRVVISKKK